VSAGFAPESVSISEGLKLVVREDEFRKLFDSALEKAATAAEQVLRHPVPRVFEIKFHGLAPHTRLLSADLAFEQLYIGPDRFYRVIDVSVCKVTDRVTTIYLVVSGHPPSPFGQTWNQPKGSGPFKQVLATRIETGR